MFRFGKVYLEIQDKQGGGFRIDLEHWQYMAILSLLGIHIDRSYDEEEGRTDYDVTMHSLRKVCNKLRFFDENAKAAYETFNFHHTVGGDGQEHTNEEVSSDD